MERLRVVERNVLFPIPCFHCWWKPEAEERVEQGKHGQTLHPHHAEPYN